MTEPLDQCAQPPAEGERTIQELIRAGHDGFTVAERKLAAALLENYPAAGLASITILAENAGVSTPTVARMVKKLGFGGYPQFHQALRAELEARVLGPIQKHDSWASEAPAGHILNRFADHVTENIRHTLAHVDPALFDAAAQRLADTRAQLYIVGGRITRALADYLFTHMQVIRPGVTHLTASSATWPHYLVDMQAGDVLVIFDIRRYESNLLRLAELAAARGVHVVLLTDQWGSPVEKVAAQTFNCRVEIPSAWDSNVSTMVVLETLVASVQEQIWPETSERMKALENLFDMTNLFRRG